MQCHYQISRKLSNLSSSHISSPPDDDDDEEEDDDDVCECGGDAGEAVREDVDPE